MTIATERAHELNASTRAQLLEELALFHRGKDRGVGAYELAMRIGIDERVLRKHISALREEGEPIAATPATGYYLADTPEELAHCCAFLRQRSMHSLRLEAQMRRIALPELLGQLHLTT